MKKYRTIAVTVLMAMAMVIAYWLGYRQGNSSTQSRRLVLTNNLRQIGFAFHEFHRNDVSYTAMTNVLRPNNRQKHE